MGGHPTSQEQDNVPAFGELTVSFLFPKTKIRVFRKQFPKPFSAHFRFGPLKLYEYRGKLLFPSPYIKTGLRARNRFLPKEERVWGRHNLAARGS